MPAQASAATYYFCCCYYFFYCWTWYKCNEFDMGSRLNQHTRHSNRILVLLNLVALTPSSWSGLDFICIERPNQRDKNKEKKAQDINHWFLFGQVLNVWSTLLLERGKESFLTTGRGCSNVRGRASFKSTGLAVDMSSLAL